MPAPCYASMTNRPPGQWIPIFIVPGIAPHIVLTELLHDSDYLSSALINNLNGCALQPQRLRPDGKTQVTIQYQGLLFKSP